MLSSSLAVSLSLSSLHTSALSPPPPLLFLLPFSFSHPVCLPSLSSLLLSACFPPSLSSLHQQSGAEVDSMEYRNQRIHPLIWFLCGLFAFCFFLELHKSPEGLWCKVLWSMLSSGYFLLSLTSDSSGNRELPITYQRSFPPVALAFFSQSSCHAVSR